MTMKAARWRRPEDVNKIPARPPRQHRVVSVSLGRRQANALKAMSRVLASRRISSSEIARVAIDDLCTRLAGMSVEQAAAYIIDRGRDDRLFVQLLTPGSETKDGRV